MHRTILSFFVSISVLLSACVPVLVQAQTIDSASPTVVGRPRNPVVTVFVVPAMSDEFVLPKSVLQNPQTTIRARLSAGEYKPLSFVLKSRAALSNLQLQVTELRGDNGITLPVESVDIRLVKLWYQNWQSDESDRSQNLTEESSRQLTPELLLKDETAIRAQNNKNYLRDVNGKWIHISEMKQEALLPDPLFQDAKTLRPFTLKKNRNKQFWLTAHLPQGTPSGKYHAVINLLSGRRVLARVNLYLEVLPFTLSAPPLEHSLYYDSALNAPTPAYVRSAQALLGELKDLQTHLVNPMIAEGILDEEKFREHLSLRVEAGFDPSLPLYIQDSSNPFNLGFDPENPDRAAELQALTERTQNLVQMARETGIAGDVYVYGIDEPTLEQLAEERDIWDAIHAGGAKVFCAISLDSATEEERQQKIANIISIADVLDLAIVSYEPIPAIAEAYHQHGHKVGSYANPQAGHRAIATYRRNYGLLLWQAGYDVATTWAYQGHGGLTWNVFDYDELGNNGAKLGGYDEVFTYPSMDGAIDTLQWEGWRESATDLMYLSTLLDAIEAAQANGQDVTEAQSYLAVLRQSDLMKADLDAIREEMIDFILRLNGDGE